MSAMATVERDVVKKKSPQVRTDEAVRIRSDVAAKARVAAAYLGITIADYVSNVLATAVDRDIEEGHNRLKKVPVKAKRSNDPGN